MTDLKSFTELSRLDGRVAVITGGAHGIGLAIARRFSEVGARVVLADIDEGAAEEAAAELRGRDFQATGVALDVAQNAQNQELVEQVVSQYGRLDIWINNAALQSVNLAKDMTVEQWREVMMVNVDGVFFGGRAAAVRMAEQGRGVILNIGSTAGFRVSNDGHSHYGASKSAVRGITQSLAREFGPHGVRVLGIAPVATTTETALSAIENAAAAASEASGEVVTSSDILAKYVEKIPLRRVATPDDMALVATFCVSDVAGYITGTMIPVDGGYLAV